MEQLKRISNIYVEGKSVKKDTYKLNWKVANNLYDYEKVIIFQPDKNLILCLNFDTASRRIVEYWAKQFMVRPVFNNSGKKGSTK